MELVLSTGRSILFFLCIIFLQACDTRYTVQDLAEQQRIAENSKRAYSLKDPVNVKYKTILLQLNMLWAKAMKSLYCQ
jgi:hypothetical protein